MTGDMVVARGRATADGRTLFGHNSGRPAATAQPLCRIVRREHVPGERVRMQFLELAQARQTWTVLGSQPGGQEGIDHGVNEHHVAAGWVPLPRALPLAGPALTGPELVRLLLERSSNARHAVDLLADLVERHGVHETDAAFLLTDAREAFAVETAGRHWVYHEVGQVRAAGTARIIGQDWDRISCGLAGLMIEQGRWPEDGSKLDCARALRHDLPEPAADLRRWGRATLLLEQQNGHLDAAFVRRLLGDHYEDVDPLAVVAGTPTLCQHAPGGEGTVTAASLVTALPADPNRLPLAWCAFGPPCSSLYFPLFLDGELPASFTAAGGGEALWRRLPRLAQRLLFDPERWVQVRDVLRRLQARFDREAEEFTADAAALKRCDDRGELQRQAGFFMQHVLERFEEVAGSLFPVHDALPKPKAAAARLVTRA